MFWPLQGSDLIITEELNNLKNKQKNCGRFPRDINTPSCPVSWKLLQPKLQPFHYNTSPFYYYSSAATQQGNTIQGDTDRGFQKTEDIQLTQTTEASKF